MKITLNGQEKQLTAAFNLESLIKQSRQNTTRVIAEVNGRIVKSTDWDQTVVQDGDVIELVSFVGGG